MGEADPVGIVVILGPSRQASLRTLDPEWDTMAPSAQADRTGSPTRLRGTCCL